MLQNEEFIQEFVEEARTHVEKVESGLLEIAQNQEDTEPIHELFRCVHSIKGTAGFFGLQKIVKLSHTMENLFGEVRNGRLQLNDIMIDVLLAANDCLRDMIENVGDSESTNIENHVASISAIVSGKPVQQSQQAPPVLKEDKNQVVKEAIKHGHHLYRMVLRLNEDLGSKGITPIAFFNKIQSIGHIIESYSDISDITGLEDVFEGDIRFIFLFTTVLEKNLVALALGIPEPSIEVLDANTKPEDYNKILMREPVKSPLPEKQDPTPVSKQQEGGTARKGQGITVEDSIRVHVNLLNDLMNLASELVLGRNQLLRALDNYRKNLPGLEPILQNVDHITTELQERIMQTRMQPLANVFNKFPRLIRELSRKLEKEIELEMAGTDVELDKSIIESLADPLTHIIRNAADHGIEDSESRLKAGKDKKGTIHLNAYHEGGHVTIDISDDGAGINVDKLKQKAIEKELVLPEDVATMGEKEILDIIFQPGFSTVTNVTDVSGRGVGMDVVRTNIEKMGGTIEISSQLGKGTTFSLNLPLTLAIISSLIVEIKGQKFALPQANLQEMVRVKPGDSERRLEYVQGAQVLRLRDKLLPLVSLSNALGLEQEEGEKDQQAGGAPQGITRILVLKIGSRRFGLVVDAIHDGEEILVKPLPHYLKDCRAYSGVTILGDGGIAMILDPEGIAAVSELKFIEDSNTGVKEQDIKAAYLEEQQTLLMFKCSGPETFGLHLAMVSRVEEIDPTDIQNIGDKEYIEFRGHSLRLIRPEQYLPVSQKNIGSNKLYVIVPKLVKHPIGILIEKVYDTAIASVDFNRDDIRARGIMGTIFWDNRIVLMLNLYELFEMAAPEYYQAPALEGEKVGQYTVLLAEDTPFFRKLEKEYMEDAGYRVIAVDNGKEALEVLSREKVDVVVSDISMPVMDGMELIRQIRQNDKLDDIPVIAVTSLDHQHQIKAGMEAGFDFYESKLDKQRLLEKLEQAVAKRRGA